MVDLSSMDFSCVISWMIITTMITTTSFMDDNNYIIMIIISFTSIFYFLPKIILGMDGCFPTALGRQSTFSNILVSPV